MLEESKIGLGHPWLKKYISFALLFMASEFLVFTSLLNNSLATQSVMAALLLSNTEEKQ